MDVPTAVREDLLRFLPEGDQEPERLRRARAEGVPADTPSTDGPKPPVAPLPASADEVRKQVWNIIWGAPQLPGGERIAEATSAI
ncbi:MAG: hypothetical protein ACOVPA_05220, partial [Rubrivivax sp.]